MFKGTAELTDPENGNVVATFKIGKGTVHPSN